MSWFSAPRRRARGCLVAVFVGVSTLALAGCGFQPLYGTRADGSVSAEMAQIDIDLIDERLGQQLHNLLRNRMTPSGPPAHPLYRLNIEVSQAKRTLAIRNDESKTRANLELVATITLFRSADGVRLYTGRSRSTSSYNILDSDFATLSAESDAQRRAVRDLSDDIALRVSAFLLRNRTPQQ